MKSLRILIVLTAMVAGLGGAKRPPVDLRVHEQGSADEAPTFAFPYTLMNGQPVFLRRLPLLTQREVKAVYPFPAADGSYGAYLMLDSHGDRLLEQFTMERQGRLLVVIINGRQVSNLVVDRPIKDGIVGVARGLTPDDVEYLSQSFPVLGQTGKKR